MIGPKKLASLPRKTRLRKIVTILEEWGRQLDGPAAPDRGYVSEVLRLLEAERRLDPSVSRLAGEVREGWPAGESLSQPGKAGLRRRVEHLQYALMEQLGLSPADWDFYDPQSRSLSREHAELVPLRCYLDDIRSPFNVGSIFRTAEAFGAQRIYVSAHTARPDHPRAVRTSMGCAELLPWEVAGIEEVDPAERGPLFALELGGTPLDQFTFPREGTVAVGSEELGVSPEVESAAREEAGIVSIPLSGAKASLNVAVAFGILMQRWREALRGGPD